MHALELVCGPCQLAMVYSSWNIIPYARLNLDVVHWTFLGSIWINYLGFWSWHYQWFKTFCVATFGSIVLDLGLDIMNGIKTLCVVAFGSLTLDLSHDIINGIKTLCVVAFKSNVLDLGLDVINGIKWYVCIHLRLYVAHGTFLRCVALGTSCMACVCMHLRL